MELNYLAIAAASVAVFVVSSVYYIAWGRQLAQLSPAYADQSQPPAWKLAAELVRSLVVALVVAGLVALLGITDLAATVVLAVALWIGFPVVLLAGSVIHENVPPKLAAIHSGDWLAKLVVIATIVSVWR